MTWYSPGPQIWDYNSRCDSKVLLKYNSSKEHADKLWRTHVVIFTNILNMEPMTKFVGKWTTFTVLRAKTCIKLRPGHKNNDPSELFKTIP